MRLHGEGRATQGPPKTNCLIVVIGAIPGVLLVTQFALMLWGPAGLMWF